MEDLPAGDGRARRSTATPTGGPFLERARQLGIRVVATHRGIGSDSGAWTGLYSPRDVVPAAAANPDIKFLVYHSGWQSGVAEDHPFNMADAAPRGRRSPDQGGARQRPRPDGNVYAELGTTWFNLMSNMNEAAHVLGKLLKYLGPDRILWGTDSYNNGGPQPQIQAFRAFQIPESMQKMYGYPALTPEVKRKIFGLNAAAVYGVDPQLTRRKITQDRNREPRRSPAATIPRVPARPAPARPAHAPRVPGVPALERRGVACADGSRRRQSAPSARAGPEVIGAHDRVNRGHRGSVDVRAVTKSAIPSTVNSLIRAHL